MNSSRERDPRKVVVTIVATLLAFVSLSLVRSIPGYAAWFKGLPDIVWWLENTLRPLIPIAAAMVLVYGWRPRRWADELGLNRPILKPFLLALAITAPLYVVPMLLGSPLSDDPWLDHLFGAGIWPLREEISFRGYSFGQIYLYSGWGLWPSALFSSFLFGLGHMSNAALAGLGIVGQLGNAAFVGANALALSWVYARWNRNLWLVFFLHGLANLWGSLFQLGEVAVESWLFSGLLVATLALGVVATIQRHRLPWFRELATPSS